MNPNLSIPSNGREMGPKVFHAAGSPALLLQFDSPIQDVQPLMDPEIQKASTLVIQPVANWKPWPIQFHDLPFTHGDCQKQTIKYPLVN